MSVAELSSLQDRIVEILSRSGGPLTIPAIEAQLGASGANTFDVRDAVWRLVDARRAEFTPQLYVKLVKP